MEHSMSTGKVLRHSIRLLIVMTLGIGGFVALLTQFSKTILASPSDTLDVCAACTYTTIQTAVNAANPDDTIRVAEGVYQDVVTATGLLTTTVLITKDLTLLGGFSPDFQTHDPTAYETIIDGQTIAKGIYVFGSNAHVEGFTIINGLSHGILVRVDFNSNPGGATIVNNHIHDNPGTGIVFYQAEGDVLSNTITHNVWEGVGIIEATAMVAGNTITQNSDSGIYATRSTITIEGNQILSNTADYGAGIALDSSTQFTVTHNVIRGNQALLYNGGGIATGWEEGSTGIISYNEIVGNESADHGGGIIIFESAEVTISHNQINLNTTQWGGGGIHVRGGSAPVTIENNTLYTNTADYGAGILIADANNEALISQNDIRFNQITGEEYQPGGIYVDNMGGRVTVINNVIANNDNRGVKGVNYSEIKLINNTIVGNGASGIEMHAWPITSSIPMTATLVNNIIANHPDCAFFGFYGAVFAAYNNDVVGHDLDDCGATIVAESGNINADPFFADDGNGDYHLTFASPAIDSGTTMNAPLTDIENNTRPQGSGFDMGAYEAIRYQLFLPGIAKPGIPPSDNFTIENRSFGQGYGAYSGDSHVWLSDTDGWGFAPQSPTDVEFYRWDGTDWNLFQTLPSGGWYFLGIDLQMLSATEGWAVAPRSGTGPSTFFRWDGSQWTEGQSGLNAGIISMDFRSSNDGWAVGYPPHCCGAKFYHWDGVSWTEQTYLVSHWPVADIVLLNNGDGWAVGSTIARQSGNSWIVYGSPVSDSLDTISMVSANDGWIVGEAGTILHWDGAAWTAVASPTTEDLRDIEMLQSDHGWAVGMNGTILRWNGSTWFLVDSPVNANFSELDMVGINEGWIPYHDSVTSTYGVLHITTP